jgi:hypothetical protein
VGSLTVGKYASGTWLLKDNLFDQTTISQSGTPTHDYNSYVTNKNRLSPNGTHDKILTNAPVFQTSYLGNYYYPTNGGLLNLLIDAGSRYATNAGLYHFTVTTNQVKETGTKVDIGFHYVATYADGVPYDTDEDGVPDYRQDPGGSDNYDTDGDGLSDLHELQVTHTDPNNPDTGNTGVSDGYKDLDNDGWANLQEYQNGTDPNTFNTPPPPRAVSARLDASGTNVILSWASGGGPVTNYVIETGTYGLPNDTFQSIGQVSSSTFNYTDSPQFSFIGNLTDPPAYFVRANYSNGNHGDSQQVLVNRAALNLNVNLVRGSLGQMYLVVASPPPDLSRVLLFWTKSDSSIGYTNIYATNLVNGIASVPHMAGYQGSVFDYQAIATNGDFGERIIRFPGVAEEELGVSTDGFVDASPHLKENLRFLLRAATLTQAFSYDASIYQDGYGTSFPEYYFARAASSTTYEYSGYRTFSPNLDYSFLDKLLPIQQHYLWRNYVYDSLDFASSGALTNGADYNFTDQIRVLSSSPKYEFSGVASNSPPAALAFSATNSPWLFARWVMREADLASQVGELGLQVNTNTGAYLPSGTHNLYGLLLDSVRIHLDSAPITQTFSAGGAAAWPVDSAFYYPNAGIPALQSVGYYFNSQTPYFQFGAARPPVPGSPDFAVTNTPPLLIASVGQPFTVAGWAKQAITNGSAGKYAYLEQYFDKAYRMTNGVATTNQTGILSPYGEFFPTEPGQVALVTMPDIETGQRSTGAVNVIKLQLDVNHDGAMDLTFAGPDNTSYYRPFVFWVNNDHDEPASGSQPDRDIDITGTPNLADSNSGAIRCQRNLEDFARLWIAGLPALPTTNGYTVTLSMSPSSGNPAVNLYRAYDTNGGIGYLTDTNAAAAQFTQQFVNGQLIFDYAQRLAPISSSQSYTLPVNSDGTPQFTRFLFEGSGIGIGELALTIHQGTNVIAQTSTWLDMRNVKDFYERMVVTNNFSGAISNWSSGIGVVENPQLPDTSEDQNLIVLVHGINVSVPNWLTASDTVFKRLYWSGYQGKFATIKWSCLLGLQIADFNTSELNSYKSSSAMIAYLNQLRTRFPDHGLHLLAHSQGNAVVSEAIKLGAPFDTYILSEGAIAASAYDVNAPIYTNLFNADSVVHTPEWQPMGYRGAYTNFTGRVVNFYNLYDPVLDKWIIQQLTLKPNEYLFNGGNYSYDGTNSWHLLEGAPALLVTDTQESRSMVSRSRTLPIGQSGPASGHGVIQSAVDLNAQFGFFNKFPDDHSAQWVWPIQTTRPYFQQVLTSCQIQPAP